VLYYNGTNLVRLAPGTLGHFLKTNGAAANPEWSAGTGGSIQLGWEFDAVTAEADPTSKKFRMNNGTPASVTALFINDNSLSDTDASAILGNLDADDRIYIQQLDDATKAILVKVVTVTDNTGWFKIDVTVDDSGTIFDDGADCGFVISYTGMGAASSLPVVDTVSIVEDPGDGTKEMRIDVGNVATATVRTLEMPDADVLLRKNNLSAAVAPVATDDANSGYAVNSIWIDTTADKSYILVDSTVAAAIWNQIDAGAAAMAVEWGGAASDEDTDLAIDTNALTFRMPFAMTLTEVRINVKTAPVGAVITVDITENGTTIFSTKATIDATEKTSVTAAIDSVISDSALGDDSEMIIKIDTVGGATKGTGLKWLLIGTRN